MRMAYLNETIKIRAHQAASKKYQSERSRRANITLQKLDALPRILSAIDRLMPIAKSVATGSAAICAAAQLASSRVGSGGTSKRADCILRRRTGGHARMLQ